MARMARTSHHTWLDGAISSVAEARRRIAGAIAAWRERARIRGEFDQLAACGQLDRTLADIGLMPCHVAVVIKNGQSGRRSLHQMLERLGIPPEPLPPGVNMRAIQWRCIRCEARKRCHDWLSSGTSDDGFHAFCPNADDLEQIRIHGTRGTLSRLDQQMALFP
jgi:uncharacterized protein YjiS (DUF1127 family)